MSAYQDLQRAEGPVFHLFDEASPTVLIVFSGKQPNVNKPGFNLGKGTIGWPVNKIYVRDLSNLWYHGEHPGIGGGVDDLAAYLFTLIDRADARRVVTVGGSMGGYAAILFGFLLGAQKVVAFGPQTFIDKWNRLRYWDYRSMQLKKEVYASPYAKSEYYDLRSVLLAAERRPSVRVHIGAGNRIDRGHARHLWGISEVSITYHDTHRHDISRVLKKRSTLYPIIREELEIGRSYRKDDMDQKEVVYLK